MNARHSKLAFLHRVKEGGVVWKIPYRLSFDASRTGGCKPTRIGREGCGNTESEVDSDLILHRDDYKDKKRRHKYP